MVKKSCVSVTAMEEKHKELWTDNGITLLKAENEYLNLRAKDNNTAVRRINRYYSHMNRALIRYCKTGLLPRIVSEFKAAKEKSQPFKPVSVLSKSRLCYNDNGVVSIYTDVTESCGSDSLTVRFGDVWSLSTGCPLTIESFFPKNTNYKKLIKNHVIAEIGRLRDRKLGEYFENVRKNCSKHFSSENYYICSEGLVAFFPMSSISPSTEGIPSFTIKWSESGPCEPLSLL